MLLALSIWDVKKTGSYVGEETGESLSAWDYPGEENRKGLLLLERVDL